MSEWTENFENELKIQINKVERLKVGYINVRLLNNLAKKIDLLSPQCSTCKAYKKEFELILPDVVTRIEEPEFRNSYESTLVEVSEHLKKKHGFSKEGYYKSLYTFIGIVIGLVVAFLSSYFVVDRDVYTFFFYGGLIGVAIGYFVGLAKDKKIKAAGKSIS